MYKHSFQVVYFAQNILNYRSFDPYCIRDRGPDPRIFLSNIYGKCHRRRRHGPFSAYNARIHAYVEHNCFRIYHDHFQNDISGNSPPELGKHTGHNEKIPRYVPYNKHYFCFGTVSFFRFSIR